MAFVFRLWRIDGGNKRAVSTKAWTKQSSAHVLSLEWLKLKRRTGIARQWVELNAGKPFLRKIVMATFRRLQGKRARFKYSVPIFDVSPNNSSRFRKLPRLIAAAYSFAL